jgi:phage shock protein A
MPDIDFIRTDIEYRRRQVQRLRSEIRELQHSGISSVSAEVLLDRMRNKIDELCAERDRLKKEQPGHNKNKVLGGRRW